MYDKYHIGVFYNLLDLQSYLDDRLIFLNNNQENECAKIIHVNNTGKLRTKKFLSYNNYILKEKEDYEIEIFLSNHISNNNLNNLHVFLVNTKYNPENISSFVKVVDSNFDHRSIYFLNSNSYFDYYYQWGDKEEVETIGDPSKPCKMINKKTRPF